MLITACCSYPSAARALGFPTFEAMVAALATRMLTNRLTGTGLA
jgi:hypothetical protein